jgi:hypothetical protein
MNRIKEQILRQLVSESKNLWQLIRTQDSSIKEFVEELKELEKSKIIKKEGSLFKLNKNLKIKSHPYFESKCEGCGQGISLNKDFIHIKERFQEVVRKRPSPKEDYDQGFMRGEDTLKRAVFMYERGDVEGKEIFILGDDDLLSLAIGLMELAQRITVVSTKKLNLSNIEVLRYNVLDQLPSQLQASYHTFATDPVETWVGFKIFVGRCIQTLKGPECSGYFGLTHLEASLKKWYEMERFLLNCNLVITDILRDFSFYPEEENRWQRFYRTYRLCREVPDAELPQVDWYRSSFLRVEAVDRINLPPLPEPASLQELYFDEESWATPEI